MIPLLLSRKRMKHTFTLLLFIGAVSVERIKAFTPQPWLKSVSLRSSQRKQVDSAPLHRGKGSCQSDGRYLRNIDKEDDGINSHSIDNGIRLNKVFKATHSRREADALIASGRVCVNGRPVESKGGFFVIPFRDKITLDGKVVTGWEKMNAIVKDNARKDKQPKVRTTLSTEQFEYVKFFKPLGVTCTTDLKIKDNIIRSTQKHGYRPKHRVFPVGRLDKETTGLILLTSDGRVINAVLRGEKKQPKIYKVMVDGRLSEDHLQRLRVSEMNA